MKINTYFLLHFQGPIKTADPNPWSEQMPDVPAECVPVKCFRVLGCRIVVCSGAHVLALEGAKELRQGALLQG